MGRSLVRVALGLLVLLLASCDQIQDLITADPETPTGLTASQGMYPDYVQLSWNAAANADSYIVQRSTDNITFAPVGTASGSPAQDTGVVAGTHYWYRLIAVNSADERSSASTAAEGWAGYVTLEWDDSSGEYYQFYTSDPVNYGGFFSTTFTSWTLADGQSFTATATKASGATGSDYGLLFYASSSGTTSYYYFGITTTGYWSVWSYYGGSWTKMLDWTYSSSLYTGLNTSNQLSVQYVYQYNTYYASWYYHFFVFANGTQLTYIYDGSPMVGRVGFGVQIGTDAYEDFPATPADVRFTMISPYSLPSVVGGATGRLEALSGPGIRLSQPGEAGAVLPSPAQGIKVP